MTPTHEKYIPSAPFSTAFTCQVFTIDKVLPIHKSLSKFDHPQENKYLYFKMGIFRQNKQTVLQTDKPQAKYTPYPHF